MTKKIIAATAALTSLAIMFTLTSCGESANGPVKAPETTTATAQQSAETEPAVTETIEEVTTTATSAPAESEPEETDETNPDARACTLEELNGIASNIYDYAASYLRSRRDDDGIGFVQTFENGDFAVCNSDNGMHYPTKKHFESNGDRIITEKLLYNTDYQYQEMDLSIYIHAAESDDINTIFIQVRDNTTGLIGQALQPAEEDTPVVWKERYRPGVANTQITGPSDEEIANMPINILSQTAYYAVVGVINTHGSEGIVPSKLYSEGYFAKMNDPHGFDMSKGEVPTAEGDKAVYDALKATDAFSKGEGGYSIYISQPEDDYDARKFIVQVVENGTKKVSQYPSKITDFDAEQTEFLTGLGISTEPSEEDIAAVEKRKEELAAEAEKAWSAVLDYADKNHKDMSLEDVLFESGDFNKNGFHTSKSNPPKAKGDKMINDLLKDKYENINVSFFINYDGEMCITLSDPEIKAYANYPDIKM